MVASETGEISAIENEVLRSLHERDVLAANIYAEFDSNQRFGHRMADRIAEFGGSWRFVILFAVILGAWIAVNSLAVYRAPFDPYPYILLTLVLSTLAALQAPLIMMS